MPPRFAYWTIILEGKPTAFRAQQREDLLPTFKQLQAKHPDVVMKWFVRGRLWESPEEAEPHGAAPRRNEGRRRGGLAANTDPRARFDVPRDEKRRRFAAKLRRDTGGPSDAPPDQDTPPEDRPEEQKPFRPDRSGPGKPAGDRDRWKPRPPMGAGRPEERKPPFRPDRSGPGKPAGDRDRWKPRPPMGAGRPDERKPFRPDRSGPGKPAGDRDRWKPRPPMGAGRPDERKPFRPDRSGPGKPAGDRDRWKPRPPMGAGRPDERKPFRPDRSGPGKPAGDRASWRPPKSGDGPDRRDRVLRAQVKAVRRTARRKDGRRKAARRRGDLRKAGLHKAARRRDGLPGPDRRERRAGPGNRLPATDPADPSTTARPPQPEPGGPGPGRGGGGVGERPTRRPDRRRRRPSGRPRRWTQRRFRVRVIVSRPVQAGCRLLQRRAAQGPAHADGFAQTVPDRARLPDSATSAARPAGIREGHRDGLEYALLSRTRRHQE